MEGDGPGDNEKELTSTSSSEMGKHLSTNKEEKTDSNDTLPTSSTDASTSIKSSHPVTDDPISSTSSEMDPASKLKSVDILLTDNVDNTSTNFDTEAELLGISISSQSTEKIEENVEDLVNDLETLLGESTDSFNIPSKSIRITEPKTEVTSAVVEETTIVEPQLENEVSSNTSEKTIPEKSLDSECQSDILQENVADQIDETSSQLTEPSPSLGDSKESKPNDFESSEIHVNLKVPEPPNEETISQANLKADENLQGSEEVEIHEKVVTLENEKETTEYVDEVKDDRVLDEEKNNEIIINDKEQVLNKEIRIENTINIEQLNLQATSPKEDQQSSSLEQHERVIGETKNTEEVDDMAYKFSLPDESMDSLDIKLSEQCKGPPVSVPVVEESPDNQMDNIVDSSTTAPTISQENDKTSESTIAKKLEDSVPISEENEELEKSVSDHEKPEIDRIEISELSEAVMLESAEVDSIDPIVEEPKDHPETVEMDTQKMENEEKIDEIIEEETSKEDKSSAISSVSEIPEQVEASLPVVVNLKEEELNEPIIEEEKVQSELIVEECQKVIDEGKADVKLERLDEEKKKNQENVPDVVDVKEPDVEDSKENLLISEPLITDNEKLTETESSQQSSCCIEESQKSSIELKDAELNSNEQTKPPPEINIRRKTVEQDLEKVVCLSEESSSDSDTHNVPKEVSDETVSSDEVDLIKIAEQVDRFPEVEESLPEIETVLPLSAAASSNLETMIAVASLQTESVTNTPEERKLSEKEIRDMEAIRMAVASITDSSEDTYDSFMIDNTVAMDSCSVQENQEPFENSTPSQNVFEIDFQQKSQVEKENKVIEEAKSECTIDKVTEPAKEGESLNKITEIKDTIIDKFEEVKENILVQEERSELILNQVVLTKPEIIEEEKPDLIQSKNDSISAPAPDVKQTSEDRPTKTRTKRIKVSEPLSISIEDVDKKEKIYSPKITIKPVKPPDEEVTTTSEAEANKGSLKMTITKQSDNTHSILKVYSPDDDASLNQVQEEPIPKLIIKPKIQQVEQQQHSPKMSTRSSKAYSPTTSRCSSPRITIKPVTKPVESKAETTLSPIKITFKPVVKPEEGVKKHSPKLPNEKNHNPKITIKPIPKPSEVEKDESHTPKVTIRPLKRPQEEGESDNEQGRSSPKITIKPVIKSVENDSEQAGPKLKIKPIKKHDDEERSEFEKEQDSPKVSIKPIEKSVEVPDEEGDEVKGRIILKINKGNLPTPNKESRKREYVEEEKSEKVAIKLKFSTTGGHTHIIQEGEEIANKRQKKDLVYSNNAAKSIEEPHKRQLEEKLSEKNKRIRNVTSPDKFNENISEVTNVNQSNPANENSRPHHSAELNPSWHHTQKPDISKIADLAAQTTHIGATPILTVGVATPSVVTPTPKRRGRPRKVPLQVREELKDPVPMTSSPLSSNLGSDIGTPEASPSPGGRPKRSCRGQNVIATLGIKPRKPRGRGRGSKVNMGDREPPLVQPIRLEPVEIVPVQPEKVRSTVDHQSISQTLNVGTVIEERAGVSVTVKAATDEPIQRIEEEETGLLKKRKDEKTPVATRRQKAYKGLEDVSSHVTPSTSSYSELSDSLGSAAGREFLLEDERIHESLDEEGDSDSKSKDKRRFRKQEVIEKCRAKRMEKLARAAELKKKRLEQAAQQKQARKAAEEAERAAAEKARATKRYGRYGLPKPQISLIDPPIQETAGTIKSHMGLFDSGKITIGQPIVIEDDNLEKDKSQPLKNIGNPLTLSKSTNEPMVVDSTEDISVKANRTLSSVDVVMLDEETRMSADFRGSRGQTLGRQGGPPIEIVVEDSQGSLGTEGGKSRSSKAPKMEVYQDLESTIFTADQLAEYSWNGQGPFMLQEQVTQFLGIKSFKRKYPNVTRRPVEMQERDYLKENGLATESQCDLGLTAVIAQDILDIMYTDFQDKYEEYCRAQREKQARDLANKQKALNQFGMKPGMDILEQAVQSAATWNQQFNKTRREQRKAYMDLQSLTIHYPKSKMKVVTTPKTGHYPVSLVPGQFIDHYKEYTPTELNNLPLNTMCYDEIKIPEIRSETDESSSGSDSDSESVSGSSNSDSSCNDENCNECEKNGTHEHERADENEASSSDSVMMLGVSSN